MPISAFDMLRISRMEIRRPFTRYACWRMCATMVSQFSARSGKIEGSDSKVMMVPCNLDELTFLTLPRGLPPFSYSCTYAPPSRWTSARTWDESALTTETPTPRKPPETLYPSPHGVGVSVRSEGH